MNVDVVQLARVIDLACFTEDRTPDEQRALLDLALAVDVYQGRIGVVTWPNPVAPCLVEAVRESYSPSEGRRVDLTKGQQEKYERLLAKWAWQ